MIDLTSFRSKISDFNVQKLCKYFRIGSINISGAMVKCQKENYSTNLKKKIKTNSIYCTVNRDFLSCHGKRALEKMNPIKGKHGKKMRKLLVVILIHYFLRASQLSTHLLR